MMRKKNWRAGNSSHFNVSGMKRVNCCARRYVPLYSEYQRVAFASAKDLRHYPVLTREVVRQNSEKLISRALPSQECIRVGTTGTTGASLKVAYSEQVARRHWAFRMRHWSWAGVEPRPPRVTLFGSRGS